MILAGDVGGTHARLALFDLHGEELNLIVEQIYASHSYPNLETIVTEFLRGTSARPDSAGIGLAGPIRDGRCVATNLPWIVDAAKLRAETGLQNIKLLNDLEANAYGIATLAPADFEVLQKGRPDPRGNAAVISAGTGLGEAGMKWDGSALRPFASEGGHSSYAPEGELEGELFRYLSKRYGHVSCERVLSGPGLVNIYEFLRDTGRGNETAAFAEELKKGDESAAISEAALANRNDLCVAALDIFVRVYGAEAGNVALKFLATAGVYLGGGIAPKILPKLREPAFLESFLEKGRMRQLLEAIPVLVILNENTALRGAARGVLLQTKRD
ncbi:MAG: glucokinase [Candidatus Acidiferrales bacterium]